MEILSTWKSFIIKYAKLGVYFERVIFAWQVHLRTINYTFLFLQALALAVSRVIPVPRETLCLFPSFPVL